MTAIHDRIRSLMNEPPPRLIPEEIRNNVRQTIANFAILMGGGLTILILCLYILSIYRPTIDRGTASFEIKTILMMISLPCALGTLLAGVRARLITS